MSQAQRATTIEEFGKKSKEPLILLISLKAGGVGLNLTMANREYSLAPSIVFSAPLLISRCVHDGHMVERGHRTTSH
jgi:hypothetical protein